MKRFLSILLLSSALYGGETLSEEKLIRRVYDHLLIEDQRAAVREAKEVLSRFPLSQKAHFSLIEALSARGEEVEAWESWQHLSHLFPDVKTDRHLLETIAWGVLTKAESAASLSIRMNALIGAALTRDVKAIPLLLKALKSSSAQVRSIAVKLSASYADLPLKEELTRLLKEEKVWYVRQEVIQVVGQLRIESTKPFLQEIICNPKTLAEEKAAALIALVRIYDTVSSEDLQVFTKSNRAGLRQLGTALIAHIDSLDNVHLLIPLLKDTSADVRESSLLALGLLRANEALGKPVSEWISPLLNDVHPSVAITAAWASLLLGEKRGEEVLRKWLHDENDHLRRLSSSALASSGPYGVSLSLQELRTAQDPYVRVNLSLGLIGQRTQVEECCQVIAGILETDQDALWMWDQFSHPLFRSLAPSQVSHVEHIPHYPAVVDQMTRLELLSVLSIVKYKKAQKLMRHFLKTRASTVTGAAAMTLLQEGDEEDLSAIEALLDDPDEKIRIQAALILGIFGSDPRVVKVLQEAYPLASREMKVHILEALARIGSVESIPFLLEIFKEPFQLLRVVAASALIQCLYH